MGRLKKLKNRLDSIPKDFTWDELVLILERYGFEIINGTGSRRKFHNKQLNRTLAFHKPHPGNIVKTYILKEVKNLLDEINKDE